MPSRAVVLFGTDNTPPPSRELRAGPLTAVLEDGQLRRISWQGREAIRAISFLVRNTSWGTYEAKLEDLQLEATDDAFRLHYTAHCRDDQQSLSYAVVIAGAANGQLSFSATFTPQTDFATNRAGFVVLHPLEGVAGEPVTVTHTNGQVEQAQFPKHVQGSQPIFDIRSVEHQVQPGVRCRCTMEGDAFEMEDQRNWTDASFKTYVRPLARPFPYILKAKEQQHQAVTLTFVQTQATVQLVPQTPAANMVTLESGSSGNLPELGLELAAEAPAPHAAINALTDLAPQWLVGRLDATTKLQTLSHLAQAASRAKAKVWLEVVVACQESVEVELAQLAALTTQAELPVHAVAVSPAALLNTLPSNFEIPGLPNIEALYAATRRAFPQALIGGGSLSYFTELNRNRPPSSGLDFITHTTCPIVHAADDHSVMESLQALPWVFQSTLQFAGKAAYWLGPTSIGMRYNPYGASPAINPLNARVAMAAMDPRQRGVFGAAFYAAYAAAASRAGMAALSFGALTGPRGVVYTPGPEPKPGFDERGLGVYPAFHVLRWLAQAAKRPRVAVNLEPEGNHIDALAFVNTTGGKTLLLVNLTPEDQAVSIAGAHNLSALALDETSFDAATQSAQWSQAAGQTTNHAFVLKPYAVVCVELT